MIHSFFEETPVLRYRSTYENRCLVFVNAATSHKQGQGELRGTQHRNWGARAENRNDPLCL
jgi:hypothetical protein